ncbi:hypothetical protein A8B82_21045 [Sulfitobacter sp. EhC04]|uniref:hypothetical protein n=1 Tax=Sulfitobacter sp. EhC04 TaxID=1849168 RepID=UPI0007F373C7|nr:hypothetical protein [Sulfitobacter sp. EhC04]OAN71263.1 hypothetical protein A8B82_21045 [Sulfitobacter sp. EhC04]
MDNLQEHPDFKKVEALTQALTELGVEEEETNDLVKRVVMNYCPEFHEALVNVGLEKLIEDLLGDQITG